MQVVAASAVPAVAPLLGLKSPAEAGSEVLAYIGMAALALIIIRLLCAPYFIWKEDQAEIAELIDQLAAPDRREIEAGLEHRITLRQELVDQLAKLVTVASKSASKELMKLSYFCKADEVFEIDTRISEIVSALSYDVALRVTVLNLQQLCWTILSKASTGGDVSREIERLWAQRKLTFRLLHRDDEVNDIITMTQIENLIGEHGETFESKEPMPSEFEGRLTDLKGSLGELQGLVKQLGPDLHLIGRQPNLSSSDRFKALDKKNSGKLTPR